LEKWGIIFPIIGKIGWRKDIGLKATGTKILVYALVLAMGCLVIAWIGGQIGQESSSRFTRDPMSVTHGEPFDGFISNLGALCWCAAAAVSLFSFFLLRKRENTKPSAGFLLYLGILSLVLLFDDLFMLHELYYPDCLGISEMMVFLAYAALLGVLVLRYWRIILEIAPLPFIVSAIFFALSLMVDRFPKYAFPGLVMLEDSFKYLGIACWLSFVITVSFKATAEEPVNNETHERH
jgi:hypothetical protein